MTCPTVATPAARSSGTGASSRCAATLTLTARHDVAVVSGIRRESSIGFLCQSLTDGGAFARYPALVIDLRNLPPLSAEAQATLDLARRVCLSRHQWLGLVRPGDTTRSAVLHAQRWRRLFDGRSGRGEVRLRATAGLLGGLAGVAPALWNIARLRRAREGRRAEAESPSGLDGRPLL